MRLMGTPPWGAHILHLQGRKARGSIQRPDRQGDGGGETQGG